MSKRLSNNRRNRNSKNGLRKRFQPRFESLEPRQLLTTMLQILHASDLEGGVEAIDDAPNFAAVVEALEDDAAGLGIPSVLLSAGDNYIPGPFFSAASDPSVRDELDAAYEALFATTGLDIREGVGRADITIMNLIGFGASAMGNHEFDPGTGVMREIIGTDIRGSTPGTVRWLGIQFPYLSSNLDFSGDANLASLYADPATVGILENTAFQSTPADLPAAAAAKKIAPAAIINAGGQYIGVVGATTPLLEQISSPGDTEVKDPGAGTNDMEDLADILNPVIAQVRAEIASRNGAGNDDIIILVTHLQQIQLEQDLVPLLHGVDVSIAGGSDTILADGQDRLRPGHAPAGDYPILTANADGLPAAVVSTDGQYSYVGRLVLEIGPLGVDAGSLDPDVSGAFATDDDGVIELWGNLTDPFAAGTKGGEVKKITDAVEGVVVAKDSVIFGKTDVFLEGRREEVRTQETNLGNLTADANLWAMQAVDPAVAVSLKNGGGIRAPIGEIIEVAPGIYEEVPPQANPLSGKEEGEISQLDIENSLRFNNLLSLVTVTARELERILEYGVAATAPGATPGQFPQVGGMKFSFDPGAQPIVLDAAGNVLTEGSRVRNLALINRAGNITDVLVQDGQLVGDPDREIRMVTLNFLAGGGDGYPLDDYGSARVDTAIGEQKALADFLAADYAVAPFDEPDTEIEDDLRIQNLATRPDTLLSPSGAGMEYLSTLPLDGAEISAYDPDTQRLFVTGGSLQVVDLSDPAAPVLLGAVQPTFFGFNSSDITSVAVARGIVAAALPDATKENPGHVLFLTTNGGLMGYVQVGALPDMLTFTPDGTKLLVANEGEPGAFDPEGSVSVIDVAGLNPNIIGFGMSTVTVTTAGFTQFNGREEELRNRGVRIFPDKVFSRDAEPEYIAVSPDGSKAFVTLQEANAFAVLDLNTKTIRDILPLGLKDHSDGEPSLAEYPFTDLPLLGTTATGQDIYLGGLSGLWFEGMTAQGHYKFLTVPDRGPNGDPNPAGERPFLLPGYQARVVEFELNPATGQVAVTNQILLVRPDGAGGTLPITGLPNIEGVDEIPVDALGDPLPYDPFGADLEGIVRAPDGSFWMPDEYRPSVYHFDAGGNLLARYVPQGTGALGGDPAGTYGTETLPAVYSTRVANRGFEAVAYDTDNDVVYAFIQTPLANPDAATSNASTVIRVLGIDPATGEPVSEYVQLLEKPGYRESTVDKIGDSVYVGDGKFLVSERDSSANPTGKKFVFEIDLQGATNLLSADRYDPSEGGSQAYPLTPVNEYVPLTGLTLEQHTADMLAALNIHPVDKVKVLNLPSIGYLPNDKPEGLALLPGGRIAVLNDNDFALAGTGEISLGIIDFAYGDQLDASDKDNAINLQNRPAYGMYMPDGVASFSSGGTTFYITANEGDDRGETARISSLALDPAAFPDAAALKQNAAIGRLNASTIDGDVDGDGDYDRLQVLGARSFSIWDAYGNLVFDSSDQLEAITALLTPDLFNTDESDPATFDTRSDNKGPEPEGVVIGTIQGRTYAFIGLERAGGGVMMYDVTTPTAAQFVQYIRREGDVAPEGLAFVSAEDSPSGEPLLVVSNEVSGTVTLYTINVEPLKDFGDAPDSYATTSGNDGPSHAIVAGWYLGASIDAELDGQPNADATGDDADDQADEDGVQQLTPLVPGREARIRVTASAAGILNAWLDLNDDGDWDDDGEHFAADTALLAGQNVLTYPVPASVVPTPSTFARFRFSSVGGLPNTGPAPDGEVGDYEVAIEAPTNDDLVGRAPSGDWWVAKSTGTNFVNEPWGFWSPIPWLDVHVADVSGDGRADVVGRTEGGEWWVAKANDTGTGFVNQLWGHWDPVTWQDVAVGDVTGDGLADIVGRTEGGEWWVAKANDTGTGFVNQLWGFWSPVTWLDVHVADVSGDGRADIVGRTDAGEWWVAKANDTGTGSVNQLWGFWSPITWLDVHAADVSGDGRADIVGRTAWGEWWVAKANDTGTGSVSQQWGFWSPITWLDMHLADLTGDGRADIVGRTEGGEWWAAIANDTGTGFVNQLWGFWSPLPWLDVQVADVSGDGKADIVGRTAGGEWWAAKTNDTGTGSVNEFWGLWDPIAWSDVHAADMTGQDEISALMALEAPPSPAAAESLGREQLGLVVEQAIQQWEVAGLAAGQLLTFRHLQVAIADLPGLQLGLATPGAIVLDVNAAGYGWHVEGWPQVREPAPSRMDLLTAVLHELGHVAGLADQYGDLDSADVMSGWLQPGIRRLPTLADLDAVFAEDDWIAD